MNEIREQIANLRSFDEGGKPADGWWVAYNDLQKAADSLEKLLAVYEAAVDQQQFDRRFISLNLEKALDAVQTRLCECGNPK